MIDIPEKDYEFIQKLAYKYFLRSNYFVELDDLIQEGALAYIKCRAKYDYNKNTFFMGYAYLRVSGAIKDFVGKNSPRGGSTVRPNSLKPTRDVQNFSSMGVDENSFIDTQSFSIEDEMIRLQCRDEFDKYLSKLTTLEQNILYEYFIQQSSIVKLSKKFTISRARIKKLLNSCLLYLKKFFRVED